MKRETITISIGPDMKRYILRRAAADFESVSDYIRQLVSKDNYRQRELAKLRNRDSGSAIPWGRALSGRP